MNVASATAYIAVDEANMATTRSTVQSDVREAMVALVSDRSTLDEARAAYAAAQASLASTQGQYRVGVTTLPSLIDAEVNSASASTNIVSAIYTFKLAEIGLGYALGTNL